MVKKVLICQWSLVLCIRCRNITARGVPIRIFILGMVRVIR